MKTLCNFDDQDFIHDCEEFVSNETTKCDPAVDKRPDDTTPFYMDILDISYTFRVIKLVLTLLLTPVCCVSGLILNATIVRLLKKNERTLKDELYK